jgi:hypothetical protein
LRRERVGLQADIARIERQSAGRAKTELELKQLVDASLELTSVDEELDARRATLPASLCALVPPMSIAELDSSSDDDDERARQIDFFGSGSSSSSKVDRIDCWRWWWCCFDAYRETTKIVAQTVASSSWSTFSFAQTSRQQRRQRFVGRLVATAASSRRRASFSLARTYIDRSCFSLANKLT